MSLRGNAMIDIEVKLPDKAYHIHLAKGLQAQLGASVSSVWSQRQVAVISDENVAPLYIDELHDQLVAAGFTVLNIIVPAGETSKSLTVLEQIVTQMAAAGMTRQDGVIALGGGVVGDLAGLVASLYMRGIALIQIPTSLTAQVDSSVGGKTAVNLQTVKNIIGTFKQPDLVLIDPNFLMTLSTRDLVEGYAEVIKTSVLADTTFFALTGKIRTTADILMHAEELIERSVRYKATVVMQDEHEGGLRKVLNFGHTIGHAVELEAHGALRHGEAVAIGMVTISRVFVRHQQMPVALFKALLARIEQVGLPTSTDLVTAPDFMAHLKNDKKNQQGTLNLIGVATVGQPFIYPVPFTELTDFLGEI